MMLSEILDMLVMIFAMKEESFYNICGQVSDDNDSNEYHTWICCDHNLRETNLSEIQKGEGHKRSGCEPIGTIRKIFLGPKCDQRLIELYHAKEE